MKRKVRLRLLEDAYIEPTAKAGDIVEASIEDEEAQRLLDRKIAEPVSEGERRLLSFCGVVELGAVPCKVTMGHQSHDEMPSGPIQ